MGSIALNKKIPLAIPEDEFLQRQIRMQIRSVYDVQKLRIETGNRLVAHFRAKLGIEPGKKTKDGKDKEADKLIKDIELNFDLVTDGLIELSRRRRFNYTGMITTYAELSMIYAYKNLREQERKIVTDIDYAVKKHPMYKAFFKHVKGCGPLMAGVLISEIDITVSDKPSSIIAYAGLDVVTVWDLVETTYRKAHAGLQPPPIEVEPKLFWLYKDPDYIGEDEENPFDDVEHFEVDYQNFAHCLKSVTDEKGNVWTMKMVYKQTSHGGRSNRKDQMKTVEYVDKKGEIQTRLSLGYNPFLKTKMVGVMSGTIIKAKDPYYTKIYYDYKHRIQNMADHADKSDGHRNRMALRYMIKEFLKDAFRIWRDLEGLPCRSRYEEEYLGKVHSGWVWTPEASDEIEKGMIPNTKRGVRSQ